MQDISAFASRMTLPDEAARKEAAAAMERMGGAPGRFGDIAVWMAATQGRWPPQQSADPVLMIVGDGVAPTALAELAAARVVSVPTGDPGDVGADLARGAELAGAEIDSGAGMVLVAGDGNSIAATAATAVLTNQEIAAVVGHGPGMTDRDWVRVCAEARDTARRARPHAGSMIDMLEALTSPELAMATGIVTETAARRTPVVIDDVVAVAAALVAQRISYRSARWLCAAQANPDPAFTAALERLRLTPIVDYGLRADSGRAGIGALLALGQLRAAAAVFGDAVGSDDSSA